MGRLEFDPSWVVIRVLMVLRLARVVGDREAGHVQHAGRVTPC
jgi:fatty-acid desaturase